MQCQETTQEDGDSSMTQRTTDEEHLTGYEATTPFDQSSTGACDIHTQGGALKTWGMSEGREATLLFAYTRAELLTLFEASTEKDRTGIPGEEGMSVLDLYHETFEAQQYLRRVLAGETLDTRSQVGGRVFETHLEPIRDLGEAVTSILCIASDVTEAACPTSVPQAHEEGVFCEHKGVEERWCANETLIRALLDALPDRIFHVNRQGVLLDYKTTPDDPLQLPRAASAHLGTHLTEIVPAPVAQQFLEAMQRAHTTRSVQVFDYQLTFQEALERVHEARVVVTEHDEFVCLVRNVTERERIEQMLRRSEERFRAIVSNAPIVLFALDANGLFTFAQGRGLQARGLTPEQLVGRSAFEVYRTAPHILASVRRALAGETLAATNWIDDAVFETQFTPLRDAEGQLAGVIGVATDVSERVRAEEALRHQTLHDPLTDLPNRTLLLARMAEALPQAEQVEGGMALLMLDIDRFKDINDTFGHQLGDSVLQQIGVRLRQAVNPTVTVARLGGDEFALFVPIADETSVQLIASQLSTAIEEAFLVEGVLLQIEASIGIALYPVHGRDPMTLFRHADVAMYIAKRRHEGYSVYDARQDQYSPHRLTLLGDLRKAIAAGALQLCYQPQAEVKTGCVKSVEALVRWQHPVHGFLPPDQFLPLAEQTGLITPLTHWVVETAVQQCRYWLDEGHALRIAVNLSVWNLRDTILPDTIATLLARYRVPPQLLCVEVTESAMMADVERTLRVLKCLFALGVRIAIDDYGTGYASLAYLKRLPADELKIDRAFVQHLAQDQADEAIVRSTVTLAHSLGMCVVAEGVEDQVTWKMLATLGCDRIQGYYLSRPVPARDLKHWLEERNEAIARK